jgi:hypothetical protein
MACKMCYLYMYIYCLSQEKASGMMDKAGNVAQSTKESCQQVKNIKLNRGLVFSEERTSSWFLKCFYVVCRLVSR